MEKASFEFNVTSEAYEDRLRQTGHWEKFNLLRENAKMELQTYEADYKAHRDKRIAGKYKEIANQQRELAADEIKTKAIAAVDDAHKDGYKMLYDRHHSGINEYVQQALGLRKKGFERSRSGWLREFDRSRSPSR